jgi:hypothetical protein
MDVELPRSTMIVLRMRLSCPTCLIKALTLLVDFNRSKQDRGQKTPETKIPANLSFSSLASISGVRCGVSDPNGHGWLTC